MTENPILDEWADDYEPGTELFCTKFDADDFDDFYGEPRPDGATVAVRRGKTPPQGWIIKHAELSDMARTKLLLEMHASPGALEILYGLTDEAFDRFIDTWGKDGGIIPGKSPGSTRRSGSKKKR